MEIKEVDTKHNCKCLALYYPCKSEPVDILIRSGQFTVNILFCAVTSVIVMGTFLKKNFTSDMTMYVFF